MACEGPAGPVGDEGDPGAPGDQGEPGDPGDPGGQGDDGDTPLAPWLTAPGISVEIQSAAISGEVATVTFRITDPNGVPLDRTGLLTEGTVGAAFALAWLDEEDGDPLQYTSYITRQQTSPITDVTATQATTESTGTFEVVDRADGVYRYTFAAAITPIAGRTHTVGIAASRAVDGETVRTDAVHHFMPDGGAVATTREVVTDAQCDSCHGEIDAHGGRYNKTAMCAMCHTPQTTDPDTGNTVDFKVMIHKVHRGADLPSVIGGTPYQIIGNSQSLHDFSTVHFPQQIARCESCHAGAQGDYWQENAAREACVSCHDNISFATPVPEGQVLHSGGVQPDNAPCTVCHPATGSIAGVADVHLMPAWDPASPEVVIELQGVTNAGPGQAPIIAFRVTVDGAPRNIQTSPMSSLRATFSGPNTDFARYWQATIQGSGATGTLTPVNAGDGIFTYQPTAAAAIPVDATGSFTVGMEGYLQAPDQPRYTAVGPMLEFAVTDEVAVARREIIDPALCNNCHYDLQGHGGSRRGARSCLQCHNPNNANDERVARLEGTDVFVETVDFKVMIHKIHAGEDLTQPYFLGGFPAPSAADPDGTMIDFGETRYPRALEDCAACHDGDTFALPLADGVLPSRHEVRTCLEDPAADPDALCDGVPEDWSVLEAIMVPPQTAVCTGCHDSPSTLIHAEVMTNDDGQESCGTCHDPGSMQDVATVHGL